MKTLHIPLTVNHFSSQLSLAVAKEMIRQPLQALRSYSSVHTELEEAITHYASASNSEIPFVALYSINNSSIRTRLASTAI